jgi:hypothetical protein
MTAVISCGLLREGQNVLRFQFMRRESSGELIRSGYPDEEIVKAAEEHGVSPFLCFRLAGKHGRN